MQRVANTSNILFDNDIVSIAVDSSGKNYWFGTQYNGVYLLHDTSSIVAIKNIPAWSTMDVAAYPNPSQDVFTIQYSLKQACNVNITVSDLLGRKCDEENFNNQQAGKHIKLLSLKKNPVGIYFVKIISGTQIGVTRLVKE